jgi:hypothetical protein
MVKFRGRSKFEDAVANDLEERGIPYGYETTSYSYLAKPYNAKCFDCNSKEVYETRSYTPDFFLENGVIVEAKGRWMPKERKLLVTLKESNPELDIRMLFMRDNWLTTKRLQRYSDWCNKRGIKWAVSRVPMEWANNDAEILRAMQAGVAKPNQGEYK